MHITSLSQGRQLIAFRYSDFLYGLSTTNLSSVADTSVASNLAASDRLRLIHDYVTSTVKDGGLGIITGMPEWNRVESVIVLQDHDFNDEWIKTWSTRRVGLKDLDKIRAQVRVSISCLADS
jgi:anoctamin-10